MTEKTIALLATLYVLAMIDLWAWMKFAFVLSIFGVVIASPFVALHYYPVVTVYTLFVLFLGWIAYRVIVVRRALATAAAGSAA